MFRYFVRRAIDEEMDIEGCGDSRLEPKGGRRVMEDRKCPIYSAARNGAVQCLGKECAWYNALGQMCMMTTIGLTLMCSDVNNIEWRKMEDGE